MIHLLNHNFFIYFFSINAVTAVPSTYNSISSFQQAIDSAVEGDIIILKDSIYKDDFTLLIQANGTHDQPIIVRAETKNGVTFTGNVRILIGGSYIYFQGFNFIQGNPSAKEVIKLRKNSDCNNCKVFNITFDGYNPEDSTKTVHWIDVRGRQNEIAHCSFLNKRSLGNSIVVGRLTNDPDHHLIHHNFFYNRIPILRSDGNIRNGQEAMKIGNSGTFRSNSHCSIFNNYFLNWNGEIEIISNKSGSKKYYNNTFENNFGALNLRHGDSCEIYNNYFFGKGKESENSGTIRISGRDHKVYNNYIEETSNGSLVGAIVVMNGEENAPDTAYQVVEDVEILFNTIVNCKKGIRIGISPNLNSDISPHQINIENNIYILPMTL